MEEAVSKPGTLMRAYSLFCNYSLGNQILALIQANERSIPLGSIASYNKWRELGRHVKKGEKAITLCMSITLKRKITETGPDGSDVETEVPFKYFVFKRNGSCCRRRMAQSIKRPPCHHGTEPAHWPR